MRLSMACALLLCSSLYLEGPQPRECRFCLSSVPSCPKPWAEGRQNRICPPPPPAGQALPKAILSQAAPGSTHFGGVMDAQWSRPEPPASPQVTGPGTYLGRGVPVSPFLFSPGGKGRTDAGHRVPLWPLSQLGVPGNPLVQPVPHPPHTHCTTMYRFTRDCNDLPTRLSSAGCDLVKSKHHVLLFLHLQAPAPSSATQPSIS